MSSTTFVGKPDVMVAGPPPPPPPPPVPNQLPAMRINTVENTAARKPQIVSNDTYEPPAAIQNAMLTKDKKPFTYTPGMGGKLDLSQIRSPRMARRVAKNANDEGIEGPPKLAVESKPSPGMSGAANLMVQPQVAIPVLPVNIPTAPHINRAPSSVNKIPSNALDKQTEVPKTFAKVDTKAIPVTVSSSQSSTPESPSTPTQVTLAKAPTPWMQNKNKPQENLPEWAKRTTANKVANDPSAVENAHSPTTIYVQVQPSIPQSLQVKLKQEQERHPIPQDQCQQSLKVQQLSQQHQESQQKQNIAASSHQTNRHERVIPIRVEDRPSVFDVNRESGHHQFKQPSTTLHHQQRWGQIPVQQHTLKNQMQNHSQDQEQSDIHVAAVTQPVQSQPVGTTYIIPMMVEGDRKTTPSTRYHTSEKGIRIVQQQSSAPNTPSIQQNEPGPVQSRSFRVLQKITDTDGSDDVGAEQIRKLDLSEDDRLLMNKFKEQVDHENYLHQEENPRYRGAAIPSRAFRFLQNMTESNDASVTCTAPRSQNTANKRQNRNSKSFEETQSNLPPSEQQVQEPKKYMGSAIPSRSFKILQAMTTPENIGPDATDY